MTINPDHGDARYNLARALLEAGKAEAALHENRKALTINPDHAEYHCNHGMILHRLGDFEAACTSFEKAIALKPDHATAHNNLGSALQEQGRLEEAVKAYETAIVHKPDYARAHSNLGSILHLQGRLEEAGQPLQTALKLAPDLHEARHNMGFIDLGQGRVAAGWQGYEHRLQLQPEEHGLFPYPRWRGEPLDGKRILVYAEQGVGDEITFSVLFKELAERAKSCLILCDPRLQPLFVRSFPQMTIMGMARDDYQKLPPRLPHIDYQVAAGSLAGYLNPELTGLRPALKAASARVQHWRRRLGEFGVKPKIGISWTTGAPSPQRMFAHSRLVQWEPILTIPDVTFVNLFYGDGKDELELVRRRFETDIIEFEHDEIDLHDEIDDLYALMSALDFIVTTPSTTAAMSCNLGQKACYFYSTRQLWRTLGRDAIPWFMDAIPLFFTDDASFAQAATKAAHMIRKLTTQEKG